MTLSKLIEEAIKEIELAKKTGAKRGYLVEQIELELSFNVTGEAGGKIDFTIPVINRGIQGSITGSAETGHKIILKLKPSPKKTKDIKREAPLNNRLRSISVKRK